jgi:hypothetical protein
VVCWYLKSRYSPPERTGEYLALPGEAMHSISASLVALAAHHRIPAIYQFREYALDGGLIISRVVH